MPIATKLTMQCVFTSGSRPVFAGLTGNDRFGTNPTSRLFGTVGSDTICILDNDDFDSLDRSEDGLVDADSLWFGSFVASSGVTVRSAADEAGSYTYDSTAANGGFASI